jgi:hypothetical protein
MNTIILAIDLRKYKCVLCILDEARLLANCRSSSPLPVTASTHKRIVAAFRPVKAAKPKAPAKQLIIAVTSALR